MASDPIPVAPATRRSPTARRRGFAITVPAGSGGTTPVGALDVYPERERRAVPLRDFTGLHDSLEAFNAKVEPTPCFSGGLQVEPAPCVAAIAALPSAAKRPFESSQGKPWALPQSGLVVFYGRPETPRLFHYFLPRLLAEGKQVLCLDGANRFDPLLVARLARQRGSEVAEFNRRIRVARAFTCFQLTELLVRVPRLLETFAADALVVTALPDLYFDEDVRERDAAVSFHHALDALRALRPLPLGVAVFSDATSFQTPRRAGCGLHLEPARKTGCGLYLEPARKKMFNQLAAQANQVWRFTLDETAGKLRLIGVKSCNPGLLP